MLFIVGSRPAPLPGFDESLNHLRRASTGTLGHITDFGFAQGISPIFRPVKAVGVAFTVRIPRLDASALHYALGLVEAGEVLVVDTTGETTRACLGGGLAYAAERAGAVGAVVDGPVTDWQELQEQRFPVWSRGITSLTTRTLVIEGAVQVPVQVGGAVVRPGDVVFADSDGVFFLAPEGIDALAEELLRREERGLRNRARLDAGERLPDINGIRERVDAVRAQSS